MVHLRLLALLAALAACAARPAAAQDSVAVIVHVSITEQVERAGVRRIFLARQRFWGSGEAARPVNQPPRSAVREAFSRLVLGAPPQEFTAYWNDLYFHGVSPPPVLGSDDAVLLYVERTLGAIGYTSVTAARTAGSRVRVVLVLPMT